MANQEINYVGKLRKVALSKDDVLVVTCEQALSEATCKSIEARVLAKFPGSEVLVLADGLKLGVVSSKPEQTVITNHVNVIPNKEIDATRLSAVVDSVRGQQLGDALVPFVGERGVDLVDLPRGTAQRNPLGPKTEFRPDPAAESVSGSEQKFDDSLVMKAMDDVARRQS